MALVYHFVGDTLRDGRPVPPDGEWLEHDGEIAICESGLHASRHPFDALQFAPGSILCLVEVDGIEAEHDNKLVCRRRRIVRRVDLTDDLRAFAREEARRVLHLWKAPEIVRRYLETGDESIRAAASDVAWAAASAAARAAASDAARAAAWAAASAAWAAARGAASDAAWAAARGASRQRFADLVNARLSVGA